MSSLADIVHSVAHHHHHVEHPSEDLSTSRPSSLRISYQSFHRPDGPSTPFARTGPPRSISFNSRVASRSNSNGDPGFFTESEHPEEEGEPVPTTSQFRDALEYDNPEQRSREREYLERLGRKRDSKQIEEGWNPLKWLIDTPREEKPRFELGDGASENPPPSDKPGRPILRRSSSAPHIKSDKEKEKRSSAAPKWGRLRSLLPNVIMQSQPTSSQPGTSALATHSVSITDELITGGLSTLMLRLWFERDEKGHRRVPVLLHRLRIRISDSLHPLDGNKAVFRIECEYANGAARWVIYRQLREFLSLHAHYAVSNVYNRNVDTLPEFPRTSACLLMCQSVSS
jgi:phospholipase D1/2